MASIKMDLPFLLENASPVDVKQNFKTLEEMKLFDVRFLSDTALATNDEDGNLYIYNVNNTENPNTGKWKKLEGGEFSGFDDWQPNTEYKVDQYVVSDYCLYQCVTAHISGSEFVINNADDSNISTTAIDDETVSYSLLDSEGYNLEDNEGILLSDTSAPPTTVYWQLIIGCGSTLDLDGLFMTNDEVTIMLDDIFGMSTIAYYSIVDADDKVLVDSEDYELTAQL